MHQTLLGIAFGGREKHQDSNMKECVKYLFCLRMETSSQIFLFVMIEMLSMK